MLPKTEKKTFILNLAPNGIIPTKAQTPYVPVTPEEVVVDLEKCILAGGITYLHLHVRDEKGSQRVIKKPT